MKYKTSIIIPTYNRPVDLGNCIQSILDQTVLPYELIVVDDGNLASLPLKDDCEEAGIKYVYFKKDKPGLTASRNKGIELATGDIIFFFDDDVVLFPDYIEEILNVYDTSDDIGGVGGAIANHKKLGLVEKLKKILEIPFLVSWFKEGKVLPSGFCTNYGTTPFEITDISEVDFLSGGVSSFKKEVFKTFKFDAKHFLNYGMGEDKDFTYRVSKAYKLIFTPYARLYHYEAQQMRPNGYREVFMFVIFTHYFFKSHVKKTPVQWLFFIYSFYGYFLSRMLSCVFAPKKRNVDKLRGLIDGLYEVIVRGTKIVE